MSVLADKTQADPVTVIGDALATVYQQEITQGTYDPIIIDDMDTVVVELPQGIYSNISPINYNISNINGIRYDDQVKLRPYVLEFIIFLKQNSALNKSKQICNLKIENTNHCGLSVLVSERHIGCHG